MVRGMKYAGDIVSMLSDEIYANLIRENRYMLFVKGLGISVQLTLFAAVIGSVIGLLIAVARLTNNRLLSGAAGKYVDMIRGTPVVVQLLII